MHKILMVDDEIDAQFLFKQKFRNEIKAHEFEFHFATNADEALKYLMLLNPFDVVMVLSDINMPGMNGIDLLKEIKKMFPSLKVIMVTAYANDSNHAQAMQYGADDFVTKPVDFEILKERIKRLSEL